MLLMDCYKIHQCLPCQTQKRQNNTGNDNVHEVIFDTPAQPEVEHYIRKWFLTAIVDYGITGDLKEGRQKCKLNLD